MKTMLEIDLASPKTMHGARQTVKEHACRQRAPALEHCQNFTAAKCSPEPSQECV